MTDKRPNVLVFVSHDTGRHFGCYGIEEVHTPNIDRLADEGVRFTSFYATAANCSPSRAAMFSGLYPPANGVMGLVHSPWHWSYKPEVRHLSAWFRDAGYRTAAAGIVHESHRIMEELSFDDHVEGNRASEVASRVPAKLRELACKDAPFYLQIGTFETHTPFLRDGIEPDDADGTYVPPLFEPTETAREAFAGLQGSARRLDECVGSVLAALDETGLADNTIVVFTVDHGIPFPRAKTYLYDAGIGTALIMRWPSGCVSAGERCDRLLSNVDLAPTLLDLAGRSVPEEMQGRSFAELVRTPSAASGRDAVFALHLGMAGGRNARCIRTERWKLIRNFSPSRIIPVPVTIENPTPSNIGPGSETPLVELYDLDTDPLEVDNLAADPEYADVVADLSRRLRDHCDRVGDTIIREPTRWPYYETSVQDWCATTRSD